MSKDKDGMVMGAMVTKADGHMLRAYLLPTPESDIKEGLEVGAITRRAANDEAYLKRWIAMCGEQVSALFEQMAKSMGGNCHMGPPIPLNEWKAKQTEPATTEDALDGLARAFANYGRKV